LKITIVYDNCLSKPGLSTGWGFAAFLQAENAAPLLFDTGADAAALLDNMRKLGIDPGQTGIIVISHAHGDHTGGLSSILEVNEDAEIYVPASTKARLLERKIIMVGQPLQISEGIFSTGELQGIEQSLAVKTSRGIVVVTGCSHPGVGNILDATSCLGKIYGIIGGLHGFRDFIRLDGLSLICPYHCTQYKEELKYRFPEQYAACGAGLELEL